MSIERNTVNAGRALRVLTWLTLVVALWFFVQAVTDFDSEYGRLWRKYAAIALLAATIVLPPADALVAGLSRRLAPWVVRYGLTWGLAVVVLYAIAPFAWLPAGAAALWAAAVGTRPGRFMDRHRRAVAIFLVAAISLRSFAVVGLMQQAGEAAFWQWAVLGPAYLLFGVTAPFMVLLLLFRKGEWVVVTASMWLLAGMLGLILALNFSLFGSVAHLPLLVYPMFSEALPLSLFVFASIVDILVQVAAMRYLGGRTVLYYRNLPETANG